MRHFIMDCPQYADKRAQLIPHVGTILENSMSDLTMPFAEMNRDEQCEILLAGE